MLKDSSCLLNVTTLFKKMSVTLLTLIGKKAYKIVKDFSPPKKPESRPYAEITECFMNYYKPKPYYITERVKFNNRVQQKHESVQQYVKEIKQLSVNCKFGEGLLELLRDRLVSGLINSEAKR